MFRKEKKKSYLFITSSLVSSLCAYDVWNPDPERLTERERERERERETDSQKWRDRDRQTRCQLETKKRQENRWTIEGGSGRKWEEV